MKRFQDREKRPFSLIDSPQSGTKRLLKTGVFSLLLHMVLIIFLILSLKSTIPKGRSNVYWVTIRPESSIPLPLLEKTQIQKEENKSIQEIKQREPVSNMKSLNQEIPSAQPEVIKIPQEEQKQLPHHQKEEEKVVEPIPLPMAEVSPLNTDLDKKEEDDLPISLRSSSLGEKYMNSFSQPDSGEGPEMGRGGSGERIGLGQGGSTWRVGYGSGQGRGAPGRGGSRDGAGIRQEGSGWGAGDGSGQGQGGSGRGGSGDGGVGRPYPRYAKNPKPVYPQEARKKGYQGEVLLRVEVLSNGQVGQVEVKRSSGYEVLDQSALTTVKRWKFIPGRKGEIAIPVWVNIPIKFELL